jgi:predicted transcriptional regulator
MKTEVYSWRVSSELKSDLERVARGRKVSVSAVLDMVVRDWLKKSGVDTATDEEQRRLHAAAEGCLGVLAGRNPRRAETARKAIQAKLRKRYGR